ncbi:EF-hand domain-containing family member B [Echinops telfairi]|uniref:EF-hand domain-containing family member B n=1 Tax=Echinops telfairi TaxID=9371 RepID=A0ABM1VM60_ECHTE|nr:EF-hand domain-containing family member B [Echinops telfairi]
MGLSRESGTSPEPGEAFPLETKACAGEVSEGQSLSTGVALTDPEKDDSQVLMGTKSTTEFRRGVEFGKEDSRWRERPMVNNNEETMGPGDTAFPLSKGLDMGLSNPHVLGSELKTPTEWGNLEVNKEANPSLGMPSGRMGLEKECLLAGSSQGWVKQQPLGLECGHPQALEHRRGPVARDPDGIEASLGKQPALGLEPRQDLEKDPTCLMVQPSTEMTNPVELDIGLPQSEEPPPQMCLVTEPLECQFAQQPEVKKEEAENIEPEVEPAHHTRPIYSGKFFDRTPHWLSAGKVLPIGNRVASCLTEKLPRLMTPPEVKKFLNFRYAPAGAERVFYGRANDPQIAPNLTHGIKSKPSIQARMLINPPPVTTFQQKLKDKKESVYFSSRRAPLGKSHDQAPGLPKGMDIINTTFGTSVIRELSAKEVVNPPKSYKEVLNDGKEGHELYVVSHNDYYVGEAKNRKYNPSSFHRFNLYGVPTPHFNDGRHMAKTLYWLHELQMLCKAHGKHAAIVNASERSDSSVGELVFELHMFVLLDSIAETMNVPPDHTFGACVCPDEYGAGDLIHNRLPGEYLRGKDRQRAMIAAVRHHLKNINCQQFDTLLAAFRHYDKKGDGMTDKAELQEACDQANLHLDDKLLNQLFDYCDVDQDGMINYLEFANFLNWKDRMPLTEYEGRVIIKGRKQDCTNLTEANVPESEPTLLIKPEDIVCKEPGSSEKTFRTLQRPSDRVSNDYKLSSSEINAVVGAAPSTCYPIYGVPTIRSDIPVPRIRRISDRANYGEDGNAYSLLYPTIFSQKGVFERDFFKSRSREEEFLRELMAPTEFRKEANAHLTLKSNYPRKNGVSGISTYFCQKP